ncbi:hypothetical protein GCM10025868_34140 [Angustibacter aerolatus]|uniref:OmpA-like domain-containing protein n=1 Tax=Angustibacter aerolatus TaxID=1162965 RepID=A0ABQ6JLE8_9ACTN|nr:hypothetical protein GCM10025868_34140 [Angustibacter aerolatus]
MGRDLPPVEDLPISAQQPPLTLPDDVVEWGDGPPPATPGEGAGDPVVHDVVRTVSSFGGSEEAQDGDKAEVSLPSDVLFAFDSSTLNAKAKQVVRAAAPRRRGPRRARRSWSRGTPTTRARRATTSSLSLARARAVVAALSPAVESAGIRLQAVGRGESDHLVPNVTPEGKPIEANRQRNRRVTFVFDRDRSRGGERVGVDAPKPLPKAAVARTTQPTAAVPDPVASVLSQDGSVRLDVTSVRRTGQDVVVGMALASTGDEAPWGTSTKVLGQNPFAQNGTLVNVRMVDEQQRTLALPLSYAKGACVCTEDLGSGTIYRNPLVMWAVFPAPPQSTSEVTLRVPGVGQVRDLPVVTWPASHRPSASGCAPAATAAGCTSTARRSTSSSTSRARSAAAPSGCSAAARYPAGCCCTRARPCTRSACSPTLRSPTSTASLQVLEVTRLPRWRMHLPRRRAVAVLETAVLGLTARGVRPGSVLHLEPVAAQASA